VETDISGTGSLLGQNRSFFPRIAICNHFLIIPTSLVFLFASVDKLVLCDASSVSAHTLFVLALLLIVSASDVATWAVPPACAGFLMCVLNSFEVIHNKKLLLRKVFTFDLGNDTISKPCF
jgi:hypothetical protein